MNGGPIEQLHAAVNTLLSLDLGGLDDAALLELTTAFETGKRRLATVDHRLTSELDARGTAHTYNCHSTATLLGQALRLPAVEARARVSAAEALAERHTLTGDTLESRFPIVAAAQHEGEISSRHSSLITRTIDKLPDTADIGDSVREIESFLVEQARQFTPETLGKLCRRLLDHYDPDGTLNDSDRRDRNRELRIHQRADGSVHGSFDGTPELGALLQSVLDVTAAPKPVADGTPDPRTAAQRNHDGLVTALRLVLRCGDLSTANGVVASIVLTMTADQWVSEEGLARTGHDALVPIAEAKRIAGGEARLFPVIFEGGVEVNGVFRTVKPIAAYGTSQRCFTEGARLAMIARDGGCTFPGVRREALVDHVEVRDLRRSSVAAAL